MINVLTVMQMNLKLISLIVLIVLSVFLFLFISYAELKDGVSTLIGGANQQTSSVLSEGMKNAMETIDKIV